MRISKEIIKEAWTKIAEIVNRTNFDDCEDCLKVVLESFHPIDEENLELADFIYKALETYDEIPAHRPNVRRTFFAICLFALADMIRRQGEVDRLEKQFGS